MSGVDNKRCMTCDRPVCYDEDRENIDDDLECLRTKPYCTNKGNATDWRTRCLAAEARIASFESLAVLATDFINKVRRARRQRDARGTGAMGAELPGNALSYVQPSALGELVRIARQLEIALPVRHPHKEGIPMSSSELELTDTDALSIAEQTVQNAKYGMEAMDSRPVVLARALLSVSAHLRAAETQLTAYSMVANPEFAECVDCAAKPGSPTLCRICLHNRATINRLRAEREELTKVYVLAARLRAFPVPFDDHFQLVGAVDECRSVLEPPVDDYEPAPDPTSGERAT